MSCCTIIKKEFCWKRCKFEDAEPVEFYNSRWVRLHPVLLVYRLIVALYTLAIFLALLFINPKRNPEFQLLFYTVWTYIMLIIYFLLAATVSIIQLVKRMYCKTSSSVELSAVHSELMDSSVNGGNTAVTNTVSVCIPWYMKIQWIFYNATIPNALIVTIIYWGILYEQLQISGLQVGTNIIDVSVHALNSVFLLIEIGLNRVPTRLLHFYHPIVYASCYLIFSTIRWGINHNYVIYRYIMDWNHPETTVPALIGMIVFICISHFAMYGIHKLKKCVVARTQCV